MNTIFLTNSYFRTNKKFVIWQTKYRITMIIKIFQEYWLRTPRWCKWPSMGLFRRWYLKCYRVCLRYLNRLSEITLAQKKNFFRWGCLWCSIRQDYKHKLTWWVRKWLIFNHKLIMKLHALALNEVLIIKLVLKAKNNVNKKKISK